MCQSPFGLKLAQEFAMRRAVNERYSVRAFARFLDLDHATVNQVMKGRRRMPADRIRNCAERLGMHAAEAAVYCAAEQIPAPVDCDRHELLRRRTAEAISVIADPVHWQIIQHCRSQEFQPDSRWLAARLEVSTDQANVALTRLIGLGLLRMDRRAQWSSSAFASAREFRAEALARVNQHG